VNGKHPTQGAFSFGGETMTELYIFSQDDKLLTILSEGTGLTSAPIRDELNQGSSFSFTTRSHAVYSQSYDINNNLTEVAGSFIGTLGSRTANKVNVSPSQFIKEENRVVFKDRLGDFREFVIKEIDDINGIEGPRTEATCIPSYLEELGNHIVVDKRFVNSTAQTALNAALEGTRFTGIVEVDLGEATTNFYYISSVDAVWETRDTWGGDIKDVVHLAADKSRVAKREMRLVQRLGEDKGLRFDIDHNIEQIERTVLSYPFTALYGRGSSLRIEDEEGEETGGHTRYIGFEDVEWRKSWGDPVDKPLGQKWVGDPNALLKYGYKKDGTLLHLEGIFSNQDYEEPGELLAATWDHLQAAQHPEVNYRLSVDLLDSDAELGDTAVAIDREFARPIEVQNRIIVMEYDLLDVEGTTFIEMGQFLSVDDDRIGRELDDIKDKVNRPQKPIDNDSFPDIRPNRPTGVKTVGAFQTVQITWDYSNKVYIAHYEIYGSQVADFVPDTQHLLWRGDVSAFAHEANTDETWYYYVRAVNTRGTAGEFSAQVEASTLRIMTPDILFGDIIAEHLEDNLDLANKLSDGTLDWINDEPLYEIRESENRILSDVSNRIGDVLKDIDLIDGVIEDLHFQDTEINDRIDGLSVTVQDTEFVVDNLSKEVSHHATDISEIIQEADRISQAVTSVEGSLDDALVDMSLIDQKADRVSVSVSEVRTDLEKIDVMGRNLVFESGDERTGLYVSYKINAVELAKLDGEDVTLSFEARSDGVSEGILGILENGTDNILYESDFSADQQWAEYKYSFEVGFLGEIPSDIVLLAIMDSELGMRNVKLEKGSKASGWSLAPEEVANSNKLISYINLSSEDITIDSKHINLQGDVFMVDGRTVIGDAVIGSGAIADLAVDNFHLKKGIIDDAHIDNLTGNVFTARSITADKLNVSSLSAVSAQLGTVTGGRITQESSGYRTVMSSGDIDSYSSGSLRSTLNGRGHSFYRDGYVVGVIGTNTIVGTTLRGLTFNLENDAHYMGWSHRDNKNDDTYTLKLAWYASAAKGDPKGFVFTDRISLHTDHILYLRTLSTYAYSDGSRHLKLKNFSWNSYSGIALERKDGARLFLAKTVAALINEGNAHIEVGSNSGGNYVRSTDITNRSSSNSANVRVGNTGLLHRSTSASKYKLLIRNEEDHGYDYNKIMDLTVSSWYDKANVEGFADLLTRHKSLEGEDIETIKRHYGLIAEHLKMVGLEEFITYDVETGEIESIEYDRLWTLLIPVVRDLKNIVTDSKVELQMLRARVKQLEGLL